MNKSAVQAALTLGGAVLGAIAGHFIFLWLARNQGAIGFAIPGVLASLGAVIGRSPSILIAVLCGVIGLFAGLFSAWKVMPYIVDRSFGYFVTHAHQLPTLSLVLILLGGLIAFWIPFRRRGWGRKP